MATCDVCGNEYDKCFEVRCEGKTFTFDCIECATHAIAPECEHCGCKILGHGVEAGGKYFCCAHCERSMLQSTEPPASLGAVGQRDQVTADGRNDVS